MGRPAALLRIPVIPTRQPGYCPAWRPKDTPFLRRERSALLAPQRAALAVAPVALLSVARRTFALLHRPAAGTAPDPLLVHHLRAAGDADARHACLFTARLITLMLISGEAFARPGGLYGTLRHACRVPFSQLELGPGTLHRHQRPLRAGICGHGELRGHRAVGRLPASGPRGAFVFAPHDARLSLLRWRARPSWPAKPPCRERRESRGTARTPRWEHTGRWRGTAAVAAAGARGDGEDARCHGAGCLAPCGDPRAPSPPGLPGLRRAEHREGAVTHRP